MTMYLYFGSPWRVARDTETDVILPVMLSIAITNAISGNLGSGGVGGD